MATELVTLATSEKLTAMDWAKNIEICELVAQDQRQAKNVIKAIKKRLGNKHPNVQLYAVLLLEMLMNNIGEPIHKQVIDAGLLPLLVKLVKKKSDLPVRERTFLLLDATQASVGGAKGKFPQYYDAYYELVNAGVQFPEAQHTISSDHTASGTRQINVTAHEVASGNQERIVPQEEPQPHAVPESSIIQKATAALEILREVLDAVDPHKPEAGKDEFTLDLVEQCSFQKQRVMHLVMTSRNEKLVSRAIELNEQLGRVLAKHDALFHDRSQTTQNDIDHERLPLQRNDAVNSSRLPSVSNHIDYDEAEPEDEAEQLTRRIRKGKARLKPEDEEDMDERPFGLLRSAIPDDKLNRPLSRPLSIDPSPKEADDKPNHPLIQTLSIDPSPKEVNPTFLIPPPPSKHMEREKFFQERKGDSSALAGLSLHSRNPSSSASYTGSTASNE